MRNPLKQKEIRSALLGMCGGIVVACSGVLATWYIQKPRGEPLQLDQFAINTSDSFFKECVPPSYYCETPPDPNDPKIYQPTEEWNEAEGLSGIVLGPKDLSSDPVERKFELEYLKDPDFYDDRLSPVFDVVINNTGPNTAVLTDIGYVETSAIEEEGDEQSSASSPLLNVVHRYDLVLASVVRTFPYTNIQSADPPLSIAPRKAERFQISVNCGEEDGLTHYYLRIQFHFGQRKVLETKEFELIC